MTQILQIDADQKAKSGRVHQRHLLYPRAILPPPSRVDG